MEINKKSGFYGYTIDTTGELSDINGTTDKCLIVISFDIQNHDIDVEVSNGVDDWAILTGDGETIPVSNPEVIFTNKSNCIVQFTLNKRYPSNSPCFLVFRSDTAYIHTNERLEKRPFEPNMMSGHFGFTSDNGNNNMENGLTNEVQVTIPFPLQKSSVEFFISEDPSHWGIRVGDGSIIPVHTPQVLFSNRDNGVVKFTMSQPYPSNSPVVLVYRSKDAYVKVSPKDEEIENIPVTNIRNIPDKIFVSERFDLKQAIIEPSNATNQHITWSVISGNANINENILVASSEGDIKIKASIMNDTEEVFVKTFNIYARKDRVSFTRELQENIDIIKGKTIVTLSSFAVSDRDLPITYQWLISRGGAFSEIAGANKFTYDVPNDTIGTFKYKCRIKTQYADPLESNVCTVNVFAEISAITFQTPPAELRLDDEYQFKVLPDDAERDRLIYTVSNPNISSIDKNGKIKVFGLGETIVTATYNGRGYTKTVSHTITVKPYVAVTEVQNLITEMEIETDVKLTCTIVPTEAAGREIQWVLLDRGTTEAVLNGNNIRCRKEGIIRLRCVIKKGYSSKADYIKDFSVKVSEKFIPVQNINIEHPPYIEANKDMKFKVSINPSNATNKLIGYEIQSDDGITATAAQDGEGFIFNFSKDGTAKLIFSIKNGISKTEDYRFERSYVVNKKFVAVQDIVDYTTTMEDVEKPQALIGKTIPEDATNKEMKFQVKKAPSKFNARIENNKLVIDHDFDWWFLNPNPKPDLSDQYSKIYTDPIEVEITIKNGKGIGQDFKKTINIGYKYPARGDQFIDVKDVSFDLSGTNLDRSFTAIPMEVFKIYPFNASSKNRTITNLSIFDDVKKSNNIYQILYVKPDKKYEGLVRYNKYPALEMNKNYLFLMDNQKVNIEFKIPGAVVDSSNVAQPFTKTFNNVVFRPPYILTNPDQDKNIKLYYHGSSCKYHLDSFYKFISTKNIFVEIDMMSMFDIFQPSYNDYECFKLSDPDNADNTVNSTILGKKLLNISKNDSKLALDMRIENGIMEKVILSKETTIPAENLEYKITATIEEDPNVSVYASSTETKNEFLVKLKLKNDDIVKVKWYDELSFLCNRENEEFEMKIDNKTFKKKDITEVEFWDPDTDLTTPKSLRLFGYKFTSLIKINKLPSTIIGDYCFESFLEGSTSFNQPIRIPQLTGSNNGAYYKFLKDCTSFNSDVTFEGNTYEGHLIFGNFLQGCSKFNKEIVLPSDLINGDFCCYKFMEGCTLFNSNITFPTMTKGFRVYEYALADCRSFNKNMVLPRIDTKNQLQFNFFMFNNWAYESQIAIHDVLTFNNFNSYTFSNKAREKTNLTKGMSVTGTGADKVLELLPNNQYGAYPTRYLKKV